MAPPNPYYRTLNLLIHLGWIEPNVRLAEEDIASLLNSQEHAPELAVVQDVFSYETRLWAFAQLLPDDVELWAEWQNYTGKANALLGQPRDEYLRSVMQQSRHYMRLDSEWNWAEIGEFANQTADRTWADNLTTESGYFETVLYIYTHQGLIREHLLDVLNILILDTTETPIAIQNVVDSVVGQVCAYQPAINPHELAELIIDRLRHFLYHGVLEIAS